MAFGFGSREGSLSSGLSAVSWTLPSPPTRMRSGGSTIYDSVSRGYFIEGHLLPDQGTSSLMGPAEWMQERGWSRTQGRTPLAQIDIDF